MIAKVHKCRRCSDCVGYFHHWLDNPEFGINEESKHPGNTHVCKHCPMQGNECSVCFGDGLDDDGLSECLECNGEGVIPLDAIG
jgi:hypothetical protein